jgi:hypothetical protein
MSDIIERLIEETMSFCEPENADEAASSYSRDTLRKRFSKILGKPVAWRCRWDNERDWKYAEKPCCKKDLARQEPGFEEEALAVTNGERTWATYRNADAAALLTPRLLAHLVGFDVASSEKMMGGYALDVYRHGFRRMAGDAAPRWVTAASMGNATMGDRYRHKVRGSTYRVLYEAAKASSIITALDDMTMVVYQCEADGCVWVRPAIEFFDGRFERLPHA